MMPPMANRIARVMKNPVGAFDVEKEQELNYRFALGEQFLNECINSTSADEGLKTSCQTGKGFLDAARAAAADVAAGNISFYEGYAKAAIAMENLAKLLETLNPTPAITREELAAYFEALNARFLLEMRDEFGYMESFDRRLPNDGNLDEARRNSGGGGITGWIQENAGILLLGGAAFFLVWMMKK